MGMTKRGKTTIGHYLSNEPLRGFKHPGSTTVKYKATTNSYKNAVIGPDNNSETEIPNYFFPKIKLLDHEATKVTLIDCPGFQDSYGCHRIITNAYFNYRVFSKVRNMKFIIVVQKSDMEETATGLVKTIKGFLENFTDFESIKQKIFNATTMVVTKTTG